MKFVLFLIFLFGRVVGLTYNPFEHRNLCIGGVEITNLNHRQRAFNSGECSPVILVPGFLASSLTVQINCEVLKEKNSDIFQACGWNTCNHSLLAGSSPSKEYRLWIGEPLTKFFPVKTVVDKCMGQFLRFSNGDNKYQQPEGIKISWYGNTPESKHDRNCGVNAIRDISGRVNTLRHCALDGFGKTIDMLENLGYISGINYQAIPYDFRFSAKLSNASDIIVKSIDQLHRNTGKKVILMGHSFGSIHILKALSKMLLGDKTNKVAQYISIGAPFLGSSKAIKQAIAWDETLVHKIFNIELGFGQYSQKLLAQNSGSIANFLPRIKLAQFKGQKWFDRLLNCPPEWLPSFQNFSFSNLKRYLTNSTVAQIGNQQFEGSEDDYRRLFKQRNNSRILHSLNEGFESDPTLFQLMKPDVPTSIIFSSKYATETKYSFNRCQNVENCSSLPNVTEYLPGDQTVSVISAILPGLKWIAENNNGRVKLVQYGGMTTIDHPNYLTIGSSCSCIYDNRCRHPCMHQDDTILAYLMSRLLETTRTGKGTVTHSACQSLNN